MSLTHRNNLPRKVGPIIELAPEERQVIQHALVEYAQQCDRKAALVGPLRPESGNYWNSMALTSRDALEKMRGL